MRDMPRTAAVVLVFFASFGFSCGGGSEPEPSPTPEPTATPSPVSVIGTFTLIQDNVSAIATQVVPTRYPTGGACEGRGGYSDVRTGMEVLLLDGTTTVAVGRFGSGKIRSASQFENICVFTYTLEVPYGQKFYTVKIGKRGERTYTYEELTTPGALSHEMGN